MAVQIPKIEKLDSLISQFVEEHKKIIDTKITRLTKPGENYGSEILRIDVILETGQNKKEELNLVAKLIPEVEFFRVIFNIQVSFKAEKWFYDTIVPTLVEFQKTQGMSDVPNLFPKFYGARNNLRNDQSEVIDEDAIILQENLKVKGYINAPRDVGFDLATTKLILKNLAHFHAVPIVIKEKDPVMFDKKFKPFMACFHPTPIPPLDTNIILSISKLIEDSKYKHLLPKWEKSFSHDTAVRQDFREPFATLSHRDMWVNNIMIKFSGTSPTDCKFVDFQGYTYDSPAADLFFFLFTSVQTDVLKNNLDDLLQVYHTSFVDTLQSLKSTLNFTYDMLLEEIAYCVEWELFHVVFMFLIILNGKQDTSALKIDEESKQPRFDDIKFKEDNIQRLLWMFGELEKRNWFNY